MTSLADILSAAQSLPSAERAQLIVALWDNMSPDDLLPPRPEWIAEANRRSSALDVGKMTSAVWSDVRGRARRKSGLDG